MKGRKKAETSPARAVTRGTMTWVNAHLGLMIRILPDPDGMRFHIVADDTLDTAIVHRLAMVRLRDEIDASLARERTSREMP